MVEASARDTLQPALLDRLTDNDPSRKVESRDERVVSRAQLRASVLRDLAWLFNTTSLAAEVDLKAYPLVERSILNFGLAPLSGKLVSGLELSKLEATLKEAILRFEPRILPHTLSVQGVLPSDPVGHHNSLSFEIKGELWCHPYPIDLLLKTDMDLESGEVRIEDGH
ncbi:MAG: type VI secretion system baseplate subunit TssE [Candidatus Rokuibacteriota bacterium]|nr:MAG: type VI secretion system baseplate subunit TssE [Candidatus Rokubacteria bacterium]